MADIFVVIAAYNEKNSIALVIKDLQDNGYHQIVVVDDGSSDQTAEIVEKSGALVLRHVINRGQGASLRTGIEYALNQGADLIITFDADGQHQAEEIKGLVKPVLEQGYDIALGSRFLKKDHVPLARKILLKGAVFIQWLFYGVKLTDAHNGFRALSRKAAQAIKIKSDRMEHASEIIEQIKKKKLKYKEVPVNIIYSQKTLSKGHGSFIQALKVLYKMFIKKLLK